jgi:hypothetical protein
MMRESISRRDLVKSALGSLLLAPFLRQRTLHAQAALPKRLILVFTPDSHPREWWPNVTNDKLGFALRGPLVDFVGLEQHMLFVRRLDHSWTFDNHHEAGVAQLFTGERFFDAATHYANGPSIDQILLRQTDIRGGTPISDIHLCAADRGGGDKRHVVCYSGPGQPIAREWDPMRAFANVFDGVTFERAPVSGDATAEAKRAQARRTLAINTSELRRIQQFLGQEERARLELHVEALRELELQLAATNAPRALPTGGQCERPAVSPPNTSDRNDQTIRSWSKLQADLIVSAFSCDRTRIAELGFGFSGSHHTGMMGLAKDNKSWHDAVAHLSLSDANRQNVVTWAGGDTSASAAFIAFDQLWASQVAYLARRLSEIREGSGSMLDNTLIYWGAESGTDHNHSPRDMQYLLIGGKNLGLSTGRFLQLASKQSAHKLHTSVLHALGHRAATGIGIEPSCGPLSGVLR